MKLTFIICVIAVIFSFSSPALRAADLTAVNPSSKYAKWCQFLYKGTVAKGDFQKFKELKPNQSKVKFAICMKSPGGSYVEGIKIAKLIDQRRISTRIMNEDHCLSACALIFMAGSQSLGDFDQRDRIMMPGAKLGFHAPYLQVEPGNYTEDAVSKAFRISMKEAGELVNFSLSTAYSRYAAAAPSRMELSSLLPRNLLSKMLDKPHNEMVYIETIGDAILSGIGIHFEDKNNLIEPQDAIHICENAEYMATLGHTSWNRVWQKSFVKNAVGRRIGLIARNWGYVPGFFDGIFSVDCSIKINTSYHDVGEFILQFTTTPFADQNTGKYAVEAYEAKFWNIERDNRWYTALGAALLKLPLFNSNPPHKAIENKQYVTDRIEENNLFPSTVPRWYKFHNTMRIDNLLHLKPKIITPSSVNLLKIDSTDLKLEHKLIEMNRLQ